MTERLGEEDGGVGGRRQELNTTGGTVNSLQQEPDEQRMDLKLTG